MKRAIGSPDTLPCGCRIKNRQGATIAGPYAPTRLGPDGMRICRCGWRWMPEVRFVEVKPLRAAIAKG